MKIYEQKDSLLTDADRAELGRLLLKAGHAVYLGRDPAIKTGGKRARYIELVGYAPPRTEITITEEPQ